MKKFIILVALTAAVGLFSACGGSENTDSSSNSTENSVSDSREENILKKINEANEPSALVENNGSVEYTNTFFFGDESTHTERKYQDKDGYCSEGEQRSIYDIGKDVYIKYSQEERPARILFVEDYYEKFFIPYYESPAGIRYNENESIVSTEEKDGTLKIVTKISDDDYLKTYTSEFGYTPEEFVDIRCVYEVDAESYVLQKSESFFIKEDGTEVKYTETIRAENPEKIVPDDELKELMNSEGTKKLTVITDKGDSFNQTVADGGVFDIYISDEYDPLFYLDPEYKEVFAWDKDDEPELTIYARHAAE